ncbi:MAG: peptidoglycan DD-metalloendopeptidase family protein [bacterium]|nr:peptidoglycan DD-metalloendopeptidase family protein [bacterium]
MKYIVSLILVFLCVGTVIGTMAFSKEGSFFKYYKKDVTKQHKADLARKEALLKKMRAYMTDINKQLGFGSKTKIDIPVDIDKATDIKEQTIIHTKKKIPPKQYAYINADDVNIRDTGSLYGMKVGKVSFQEKVELLAQTSFVDRVNGVKARWVLIRKTNQEEGWAFGAFIQKDMPKRKETIETVDKDSTASTKGFIVPAAGRVSSKFGYRVHPVTKRRRSFHKGIDIAAPTGTPIKASAGGRVIRSEFNRNGYGNLVVIKHEKDLSTYYGHMSQRIARRGARVKKGQLIGKVGSTGMSTGPHLHFEVRRGRKALNPNSYIR